MFQQKQSDSNLPLNYLQFHEHAFVSPLNLINVTHPAPISFGRAPHLLQQTIPRTDPTFAPSSARPPLQTIDARKLQMYQFLAERKLKEERWKKEMSEKQPGKPTVQQRSVRSTQSQQRPKAPATRSASAPKKPVGFKRTPPVDTNRSHMTPSPISFSRQNDPAAALSLGKQNEIAEVHDQLLVQLRILHHPPSRENIIDETEQEKQRRLRLKRERIKRDSRAIYNAHQELKQILQDIRQPDANLPRLNHRHLNAYKAIFLAVETLANEAPLKAQDAPTQQLLTAVLPILETLTHVNHSFGLSQLNIDPLYLEMPSGKTIRQRPAPDGRAPPSSQLLPSVYQELMKRKQQRKPRQIPSVLRPRSAESVRLPRSLTRPTLSAENRTRARSHSPLPSIKSASSIETPFHSRFSVDHILVKLAPRLLANYTGQELTQQIERARTLIPMFLTDNHLTEEDIVGRVIQMLMPRGEHQNSSSILPPTMMLVDETPEERARRVDIDVYHTQISTWEDEMSQIRQRLQNYRTNRLEDDTTRRTVQFQLDTPVEPRPLPENVHIHIPRFEYNVEGFEKRSTENHQQAFEKSTIAGPGRGAIRLRALDASKVRQIELYRRDYQAHLQRTGSATSKDFKPAQMIDRLSEFLLDEALLSVVHEVELLTVELSDKLVENELLGREISLTDVERGHHREQQPTRRPPQPMMRKSSPRSPSPLNEQYNTSSFEDDLNTESRLSRSEDEPKITRRKSPMEGTGRFTTGANAAFEHRKLASRSSSSSSSASSTTSSSTPSPEGIIIKPTIVMKKPASSQHFDEEIHSSSGSATPRSKGREQRRRSSADEDDELLLSTKTGEKIYSTDFEESRSKRRQIDEDDDDFDEDAADTMKLSARSPRRNSFDSDED